MATTGVFLINEVYELQLDNVWVTSAYVPPIPQQTFGWFGGGYGYATPSPGSVRVDRIDYGSDTTTASTRGDLSVQRKKGAATGNADFGWFVGVPSAVDRITYASDTGTTSARGPLSTPRNFTGATGNLDYGWVTGGQPNSTIVDRITYSNDASTSSARGPTTTARNQAAASGNLDFGWFALHQLSPTVTFVDRITYSSDTNTASARGPLSGNKYTVSAVGNGDFGWFAGGNMSLGVVGGSIVDRITYASDTGTASIRGSLNAGRYSMGAAGSSDFGWFGGGSAPAAPFWHGTSITSRITYASDTVTSSSRGVLSLARQQVAATGGFPG